MRTSKKAAKIVPIFLLGRGRSALGEDETEQNAKANHLLHRYGLGDESRLFIRKEEDILSVNIHEVDGFAVFACCSERFSPLIYLAETGKPIIIMSEENTYSNAIETYQYLAGHPNVRLALTTAEAKAEIKAIKPTKVLENTRICLFDAGEWKLDTTAWLKNPLLQGKLNTLAVGKERLVEAYQKADRSKAESLAEQWMKEAEVKEPSFEDVVNSARLYLAMKSIVEEEKADAAYALWCGQFTKDLGTKMCFALAKLADEGLPTGCWRGENLLPLLILHTVSKKPVIVAESFTHKGNVVTIRHCFTPTKLAESKPILRNWRNMKGTVTAYCQLPRGEVTLVNCGMGDRIVVAKGRVINCADLGGENCRMTVWVRIQDSKAIRGFVAREFAVVYGDYMNQVREKAKQLGIKVV